MDVIKKMARYIFLFVALTLAFPPFLRSEPSKVITWQDIILTIFMVLIALNMLLLIIGIRRRRIQASIEVILYSSFIITFLFNLAMNPNILSALINPQLRFLGAQPAIIISFLIVWFLIIGSVIVNLIDAIRSYTTLSRSSKEERKKIG